MPPTVLEPAGFGERLSTGGVCGAGVGLGVSGLGLRGFGCGFTTVCRRTGGSHDGHIMGTAATSWEPGRHDTRLSGVPADFPAYRGEPSVPTTNPHAHQPPSASPTRLDLRADRGHDLVHVTDDRVVG